MVQVTILVLSVLVLAEFLLAGVFFNFWLKAQGEVSKFKVENDKLNARNFILDQEVKESLRQKEILTRTKTPEHDNRRPLTSAEARHRASGINAPYLSADRNISNSEVLKEHSNG
jgi:hypothetical protein